MMKLVCFILVLTGILAHVYASDERGNDAFARKLMRDAMKCELLMKGLAVRM